MVHVSTQTTTRKQDLRDCALIYRRKERQYREAAQRLEGALQELLNRELIETLKNSDGYHLSETTKIEGEDE